MTAKLLLIKSENGLETRQDYDGLPADNPTFTGGLTGPYLTLTTDQNNFPTVVASLFWNETEQTYNIVRADGSTLSIGQENTFPMKNGAGADLLDGQLVRISGATGANPTVSLASAATHASASAIGMVTQPIANNATGNVATSISIVNGLNTSAYTAGTALFLSVTPGEWTATPPAKPNHSVSIGFVIRQHAVNGAILLWINYHESLGELNDVDTTGAATGNSLAIGTDNVWRPADLMPRATIIAAGQFSGFVDRNNVVQKYDGATRVVTNEHASGFVETSWNGIITRHASPWVLPAHPATLNKTYFYYSTDGTNYAWSETAWDFEDIQVASVRYGTYLKLPVRECHGLADPEWHRDAHKHIWTYVQSGCGLTAGTYAIGGTASNANNTPGVDAGTLRDEDLPTALAALAQGSYVICTPQSGEFNRGTSSLPFFSATGSYIQYYPSDTGSPTTGQTGKFYNVYLVGAPLMLDETGAPLANRFLWLAPQAEYDSLTAAKGESFEGLRLGDLTIGTSEYCPIRRLIFGSSAAYGTTGKVRLEAVDELERSPLRSAASAASVLSGSGIAGQPAVWASPSSLASQDAVTFRTTIGAGTSSLALGSDSTTAHRGDHGAIAYNHSQTTGNPHGTTAADVGALAAANPNFTGNLLQDGDQRITPSGGGRFTDLSLATLAAGSDLPMVSDAAGVLRNKSAGAFRTIIAAAASDHNHFSKLEVSASTTIGSIDASAIKVTATDVNLTLSGGVDGQGWDIINPTTSTGIAIPSGATLWKTNGFDVGPTTIALGGGRPIRITRIDANTWTMLGSQ